MLFSEHWISSQGRANRKRAASEELNLIFLNIGSGGGMEICFLANREFIDKSVCLSAALYPTKMSEYPGVGGAWWLRYARNERKATVLSVSAQIRG